MQGLLRFSRLVDGFNDKVGKLTAWLIMASVLVSSGNAMVRYIFDVSSNG